MSVRHMWMPTLLVAVLALAASVAQAQVWIGPGLFGPHTYYNRAAFGGNPIIFLGAGMPSVIDNGVIYPMWPYPPVLAGYGGTWFGINDIPRTSDTIEASLEGDNQIRIRWQGEPRAVARIRFTLLDKDRRVIQQQIITSPPAEARLRRTKETAYYQVVVEYINGTTTTVVSPLIGGSQETPADK